MHLTKKVPSQKTISLVACDQTLALDVTKVEAPITFQDLNLYMSEVNVSFIGITAAVN